MGKGSILEGKSLEIGGLIQQVTDGKVEHIRKGTTTQSDDGKDHERIVDRTDDFNYFEFMRDLKKKRREE